MIRVATPDDADAIASIYAPYVADSWISFEEAPPDAAAMRARIAATLPTHPWLVAEEAGCVIGYAYACAHRERPAYRWSADVSVYIAPSAHRRGGGRALYRKLLELLKKQGFRAAFAGIALPNAASVALHEACGFKPIGVFKGVGFKLGAWRDVGWWACPLRGDDLALPAPIPFAELAP